MHVQNKSINNSISMEKMEKIPNIFGWDKVTDEKINRPGDLYLRSTSLPEDFIAQQLRSFKKRKYSETKG